MWIQMYIEKVVYDKQILNIYLDLYNIYFYMELFELLLLTMCTFDIYSIWII